MGREIGPRTERAVSSILVKTHQECIRRGFTENETLPMLGMMERYLNRMMEKKEDGGPQ